MPVSTVCKVTFHINHVTGGFSESYVLDTDDVNIAKTKAKKLWGFRRAILAKECFLVYASVCFLGQDKDSWRLQLPYPVEGIGGSTPLLLTDWVDTCNNLADSLHIRLQLGNGHRANRHLRGIPDGFAINGQLIYGIGEATCLSGEEPPVEPNYASTVATQTVNFMKYLVANTKTAIAATWAPEPTPPTGKKHPTSWNLFGYTRAESIRSATRRVGRSYSPFSGRQR